MWNNLEVIKIKNDDRNRIKRKIDRMNGLEFEDYLYYVFLNLGYKVKQHLVALISGPT